MIYLDKDSIKDNLYIKYEYNKLEIMVRINYVDDMFLMSVGFKAPNNVYHNIISKEIVIKDDEAYIHNYFIPNPPFNYFSKYILKENNIKSFWEDLAKHIKEYEKYSTTENFNRNRNNAEKPYFYCIKKCPKDIRNHKNKTTCITPENEKKIKSICGEKFYDYLVKIGCTASFTSEVEKAKKPIIYSNRTN